MKATTEPEKITALYLTAQYGLVDIAKLLLTQGHFILPELIYIQAATGNLALDIACSEGHTQVVELLLNADSTKQSVFEPTNPFGFTPLCYAAKNDHHEVIDKILWSLNDEMRTKLLYSTNKNGYNPLMAAVINGSTNAIKILLTHIDKLEICRFDFFRIRTTSEQATVLYMAAGFGRADVVDLLFQELTDEQIQELLAITNCNGLSPFNVAVRKGHILVVVKFLHYSKENKERLIKSQSTINGFTALHFAAQYGQVLAARLLLSQVNDKQELLKTQDHCDDLTPFGLAVMMGQTDMVQELLKYGIELSDILNAINNIFRIKDFSNIYLSHDSIIDAHDEFESRLDSYKENRVAIAKILLNHLLRGSFLTVERTI